MARIEAPLSPEEQDEHYMPLIDDLRAEAESGYGDPAEMQYHAWESHIVPVRQRNLRFRDAQLQAGINDVPGLFLTEASSDFHDYLLEEYLFAQASGIQLAPSAEEYSANKAGSVLTRAGVDRFTVEEVKQTIKATEAGQACDTLAKLNLCCADLFNTGEDYETVMKVDTERLRAEKEFVTELPVDEISFKLGSLHYLAQYYFKNLWVPALMRRSPPNLDFYVRFGQNLTTMGFEQVRSVGQEAVKGVIQVVVDLQTRLPRIDKWRHQDDTTDQVAS